MMCTFIFIAVVNLASFIIAQNTCPSEYLRFTKDHSFCKEPNPSCKFIAKGLQDEEAEIVEILGIHNTYRSKVATGQEKQAGGLPTASNMLELTWDKELQDIAQKWAEQCQFGNDCGKCRATRSFSVGQNAAFLSYPCDGECQNLKPNWNAAINMFYDEIRNFRKEQVKSVNFYEEKEIGQFTQVIWANTWKIGCGYVAYEEGSTEKQFMQLYICNYGPAGSVRGESVYEVGRTCAKCPKNSYCGDEGEGQKSYPGLCKLKSSPPIYPRPANLLYYCDFQERDRNCEFDTRGTGKWELVETEGGTFLSVVVSQQEYAIARFRQSFKSRNGFLIRFSLRKGPIIAGQRDAGRVEVEFDRNGYKSSVSLWSYSPSSFVSRTIRMYSRGLIKFSIKFSVPANAPPQFLEIQKIEVLDKNCDKGKFRPFKG